MSTLTTAHIAIGILVIALSLAIVARRKGDRSHRILGWNYSAAMGVVLATAITLGALGRFSAFHGYTVVSLLALIAALSVSRLRHRLPLWRFWHAGLMCFTMLTWVIAVSGVVTGLVLQSIGGGAFYPAFNLVISAISLLAIALMHRKLGALIPEPQRARTLSVFLGSVALITATLVALQA